MVTKIWYSVQNCGDGIAGIELSKVFCISKAQISRILTRKRWKHI